MLMGWELFNRRQDFARLQPCDLRFAEGKVQVLIRYAKNDPKENTRDPTLAAIWLIWLPAQRGRSSAQWH